MRYRKKPVVVEAMQFLGTNWKDCLEWMGSPINTNYDYTPNVLVIHTLEGNMDARREDWIIKGIQGEFYPCKPDIFRATYEAVFDD